MRLRKISSFFLILAGCAQVPIRDETIFADKGKQGAFMVHTLTSETKEISKADWDIIRFGMLCMTTGDFAHNKAEIEQLCSDSPTVCDYQTRTNINKVVTQVNKAMVHINGSSVPDALLPSEPAYNYYDCKAKTYKPGIAPKDLNCPPGVFK